MSISELSPRASDAATSSHAAPVIVLAYPGSGAEHLQTVLCALSPLTRTAGTGVVRLCHQAIHTWQVVDGRADAGFSRLAVASVRALSAGLVTAILARDRGTRWCELTTAPVTAADTFARLYPQTRFLAAHRRAETFIRAVLDASPWGLAGPEFAPYLSAHPASTIAALAHYWVTRTTELLEFEQTHPQSCLRVRVEDLRDSPRQAGFDISDFLGLERRSDLGDGEGSKDSEPPSDLNCPPVPEFPLFKVPPTLLARLDDLHCQLAYPPVTAQAH